METIAHNLIHRHLITLPRLENIKFNRMATPSCFTRRSEDILTSSSPSSVNCWNVISCRVLFSVSLFSIFLAFSENTKYKKCAFENFKSENSMTETSALPLTSSLILAVQPRNFFETTVETNSQPFSGPLVTSDLFSKDSIQVRDSRRSLWKAKVSFT